MEECPVVLSAERIYTGFKPTRVAEALLVHGGRVVYAGYEAEAWRLARLLGEAYGCRPLERRLDGFLVPGFVDAHLHLGALGFEAGGLDLRGVEDLEELKRLVAAAAARGEGWIYGRGWDQDRMGAWPTRYDLDEVAPDRPVLLMRVCGHAAVANTEALRRLGLLDAARKPGVDYGCDGSPTGLLFEDAAWEAYRAARRSTPALEAVLRGQEVLLSSGVTAAATMGVDSWELSGLLAARARGLLRVRVAVYLSRRLYEAMGEAAGPWWDGLLGVRGVKAFMDGSLGARTAWLREPYSDDPGNTGRRLMTASELARLARGARSRGLDVAVHAIGDAAIEEALRGFEAAGCSCRIEHASLATRDLVEWMSRLSVRAVVQPRFLLSDYWAEDRLGERARSLYPFKTMLSLGVQLGFSSDAPVEPVNPLEGVYAAATRGPLAHLTRGEALPVEVGLYLYTRGSAEALGLRGLGCLEPGCLADAALLDEDPLEAHLDAIPDIVVRASLLGGRVAWRR